MNAGRGGARRKSKGSFLLGLFVGLLAGLAIAAGIALYMSRAPLPFTGARPKPAAGKEEASRPQVAGLPKGTEVKAAEKPKFDFYRILPGGEEPVSDKDLKDAKAAKAAEGTLYFLQAGAFQNPADADNQKARLALLGLESGIEVTQLPDKGTFYRVRLGPYTRIDDINRVRALLAQNAVDATLVRVREPAKQ